MTSSVRRSVFRPTVALALVLVHAVAVRAQPAQNDQPGLPCPAEGCGRGRGFVVHVSSSAEIRLENGVLHHLVTDVLQNRGGANAEVDYFQPLPPLSAFQNLTMSINGEMIAGEILPANRAASIYNAIVMANRDPALVEWVNRSLFRTRIFPIFPNERKLVELRMQSVAQREEGAIRIDYKVGTRRGHAQPDGGAQLAFTFSYPDSAHYGVPRSTTHALATTRSENGRRILTGTGPAEDITVFLPVLAPGEAAIKVLSHASVNEPGYALITITPPPLATPEQRRDVVVAVDVSGSMAGERMIMARRAVRDLMFVLPPSDRFRIVTFSDSVVAVNNLVPATARNAESALAALEGILPSGNTNTYGALDVALRSFPRDGDSRTRLVLLISDGLPTRGELRYESLLKLVSTRRGSARVFTLGVGPTLAERLMRDIAASGDGSAEFAEVGSSVQPMLQKLLAASAPIITELQLTTRGTPPIEIDQEHPRNMFARTDVTVLARYSGAGTTTLTVRGQTESGPVEWSQSVELPALESANGALGRIWATKRIGDLDELLMSRCSDTSLERDITSIAGKHAVPSPFTSYLVLEPGIQVDKDGRVVNARDFVAGDAQATNSSLTLLRGRVASLSARPPQPSGSDVVIQIRNPLSVRGFTQPLIIVDGVIQMQDDPTVAARTPIAVNLDPETIASIEVVRGAAAAALYGQRAVNGVINITTKNPGDANSTVFVLGDCEKSLNAVQRALGLGRPCCGGGR